MGSLSVVVATTVQTLTPFERACEVDELRVVQRFAGGGKSG